MLKLKVLSTLSVMLLAAGCAATLPPARPPVDGVLVGANGMSLYTFDRDPAGAGKSVCNGPCATNCRRWPPAPMPAAQGDWSGRARRRQQAVGLQGQAAVLLGQGPEARGPHGRRRQQGGSWRG
jgi:predicted lipoprotein with Yx(FWY)xxD motif